MALVNCPECEQQVSTHAAACPKCGYPVRDRVSPPAKPAPSPRPAPAPPPRPATSTSAEEPRSATPAPAAPASDSRLYRRALLWGVLAIVGLSILLNVFGDYLSGRGRHFPTVPALVADLGLMALARLFRWYRGPLVVLGIAGGISVLMTFSTIRFIARYTNESGFFDGVGLELTLNAIGHWLLTLLSGLVAGIIWGVLKLLQRRSERLKINSLDD